MNLSPDVVQHLKSMNYDSASSDLRISQAALYIRYAIKGKLRIRDDPQSRVLRILYHKIHYLRVLTMTVYLLLSFFETPTWCSSAECKVNGKSVPMSNLPKLPLSVIHGIELGCLFLLLALLLLRQKYTKYSKTSSARAYLIYSLITAAAIDNILVLAVFNRVYLCHLLRPVIFIMYVRTVRESFKRIYNVVKDAISILTLIVIHIVAFSWIGKTLFGSTGEEVSYFSNILESFWHLFVLLTTVNFPDVMLPAYAENRLMCLFFIVYLAFGLFFLMKLIVAVFFKNYRFRIDTLATNFVDQRQKYINEGFTLLDLTGQGVVNTESLRIILRELKNEISIQDKSVKNLLRSYTNLNQQEFELLIEVLKADMRKASKNHLFRQLWPSFFTGNTYAAVKTTLKSAYFELAMNILNLSNLAFLIADESVAFYGLSFWKYLQIAYLILYLLETFVNMFIFGPKRFLQKLSNLVDSLLNLCFFVFLLAYLGTNNFEVEKILKMLVLLKLTRVLKLLYKVEKYKIIFKTFVNLIPVFGMLLGVLMSLIYIYSLIGIEVFGGKVYPENPQIYKNPSIPPLYVYNNFNDFGSGVVTLFELAVVNNWNVIAYMHIQVTSPWSSVYFISFFLVSVMVALNLVVAFIIDMFNTQSVAQETKKSKKTNKLVSRESLKESLLANEVGALWKGN